MADEEQQVDITAGMLVTCRLGEQTVVGPCKVLFVGEDYVTVEDPNQKLWQTTLDRVDPADDQLSDMLNG